MDDAIQFVMKFYGVTEEDALEYYSDEIDVAQRLIDSYMEKQDEVENGRLG